jgi:hypothetical protein
MALLRLFLISTFILPLTGPALGEEPPVRVDAGLARRVIAVGDTFRLDIDVTWKDGVTVKPLALGESVGRFAVRDITYGPTLAEDGLSKRRTSLLLSVFETGALTVPPITIVYMDEDGNAARAETPAMEVTVESVLEDEAADIRDIKRPIEVPRKWKDLVLSWALLVGLGLAAAASVLVSVRRREDIETTLRKVWTRLTAPLVRLIRWLMRRLSIIGRDEFGAPALDAKMAEPYLTPDEAAIRELDRIEAMDLVRQGRTKQHYTLVSEAIRRYLERRFKVLAMESPTSFTVGELRRKEVTPESLVLIGSLLDETDLVKFAKFLPDADAAGMLVNRGRELVDMTGKPAPGSTVTEAKEA